MSDKKTIWLMGGFGNVLFQGFIFFILKQKTKTDLALNGWLIRRNIITKTLNWTIHDNSISDYIFKNIIYNERIGLKTLFLLIIKKYFKINSKQITLYEVDKKINFESKHFFGYFQSNELIIENPTIFRNYCEHIRNNIQLFENKTKTIVIHYRWADSDWAKENNYYYQKVKNEVKEKYSTHQIRIVTDDVSKAKIEFKDVNGTVIIRNTVLEDFRELCSAKILFVAPSTFSFWAAHIGANEIVYFPKLFKDKMHNNSKKIMLD
jgi:hypothetical protein